MEQKLHFIGVGGIGMSAIAKIMLYNGFHISGSDMKESRLTAELVKEGARICYGHSPANLPADTEAVVYSSAVQPDNVELLEAERRGLPVYRRAEMLAYLMSTRAGIGVAGAHGKTTTSAMIATMLEFCGQDPTVIIGGMLPALGGSNAKAGSGPSLVAEADESDGTFLLLQPRIAVVTNIEADHLDYYHDLDHIIVAFAQYLRQLPEDGFAVICSDCPELRRLSESVPGHYISYGLNGAADYQAGNIQPNHGGASADIYHHQHKLGRLQLNVPGQHNILNALAAIAVGRELGLSFEQCAAGLLHFTGTGRRYELLGQRGPLQIIDDYAHHPTEIKATIAAARQQGAHKLLAVFQPHRYTRTQTMYEDFARALLDADRVLICGLYPAFEQPIPGVTAELIVDALRQLGHQQVAYAPDLEQALAYLRRELQDEDLLLIMGAGNVRTVGERFVAETEEYHEQHC